MFDAHMPENKDVAETLLEETAETCFETLDTIEETEIIKYFINYGTGAGNEYVNGSLNDAKKKAEEGLAYTQQSVSIQNENGEDVALLKWYGTKPEEDDIVTAQFGDYGFYGEWIDY